MFQNTDFALVIIFPNQVQGLKKIEENIKNVNIDYNKDFDSYQLMDLELPKFKIESTVELVECLQDVRYFQIFNLI